MIEKDRSSSYFGIRPYPRIGLRINRDFERSRYSISTNIGTVNYDVKAHNEFNKKAAVVRFSRRSYQLGLSYSYLLFDKNRFFFRPKTLLVLNNSIRTSQSHTTLRLFEGYEDLNAQYFNLGDNEFNIFLTVGGGFEIDYIINKRCKLILGAAYNQAIIPDIYWYMIGSLIGSQSIDQLNSAVIVNSGSNISTNLGIYYNF